MYYDNVVLNQMYNDIVAKGKVSQEDITSLEHVANSNFITKNHKLTSFTMRPSDVNFDKVVTSMESFLLESNNLYREKHIEQRDTLRNYDIIVCDLIRHLERINKIISKALINFKIYTSRESLFYALFPDYTKEKFFKLVDGREVLVGLPSMPVKDYFQIMVDKYSHAVESEKSAAIDGDGKEIQEFATEMVRKTSLYRTIKALYRGTVSKENEEVLLKAADEVYSEIKDSWTGRELRLNNVSDFNIDQNEIKDMKSYGLKTLAYFFNRTLSHHDSYFSISSGANIDETKDIFTLEDVFKIFMNGEYILESMREAREEIKESLAKNKITEMNIPSFIGDEDCLPIGREVFSIRSIVDAIPVDFKKCSDED